MIGNHAGLIFFEYSKYKNWGGVNDCSFEMWIDYWNILTNSMHDGFSSRSTYNVFGRSLSVRVSFPT